MSRSRGLPILWWVLVAVAGCHGASVQTPPSSAEWFADVTEESGLRYAPAASQADPYFFPALMAGGVAVVDFNGDGRLDVFLTPGGEAGAGSPSRLYRQQPNGAFEDVTLAAGVEVHGYGQGAAVGDVNNDGRPDLFVTGYRRVWLFLNMGDGTFQEISRDAGIDNPQWGTSAAFVDYDRDGWLDLVVVNYLAYNPSQRCTDNRGQHDFCSPSGFPGTVSRLFRNRGKFAADPGVQFEDATVKAGLAAAAGPGLGVVCADFDGDRWQDLFIANDGKPNHLWVNQRDGTFIEEGVVRGVAYNALGRAEANMGIALGDFNRDGLFDLFVTHLTDETHRLWLQADRGQFQEQTAPSGLSGGMRSTGFGTVAADIDHDGAEDLVIVNGRVSRPGQARPAPQGQPFWSVYHERNLLYKNDGSGKFSSVAAANPAFSETPGVYRVVVAADFDNDGALDLLVTRVDGPARLFRNVAAGRGHWVMVRAIDSALNRDAYGAELTVHAGGRRWTRWMNPGNSFASSSDPRAHIGLGATDRVDQYHVVWPDGKEEWFDGTPVDRLVTLTKGTGRE